MAFTKITQQELNSRGATTLPNQPTIPAQQLKQEFDAPAKEIVAPKVNNLIDELEATSAAASIGAVAPTGRSGSTVKEVLDDMSEDLATAEGASHTHSNKSLLDSYDQTNANLSDAVTKKHEHSNKSVLDKFTESGGKPLYDGQTIGEGDMKKSDYDSDSTVKNAGGIKAYVDARASAAYRPAGTKTVAELLPALLIEANNNNVYNITDSGLTTEYFLEGAGKPIYPGDNVGIAYVSPNTYKFDLLRGIVDLTPYAKTADLGTAAAKNATNAVTQASTDLVESGAVYAAVHAVAQDLSDTNLAVAALQTASINLGKYKAEADSIAPVELDATGASQAYAVDEQFYLNNVLMTATSPIAQNDAIVVYPTSGYNCKPSDSVTEQIATKADKSEIQGQEQLLEDTVGWIGGNLVTELQQGSINSSGTEIDSNTRIRTGYMPVCENIDYTAIVEIPSKTAQIIIFRFDANKNVISQSNWNAVPHTETITTAKFIRLVIRASDDSDITPSSLSKISYSCKSVEDKKTDNTVIGTVEGVNASKAWSVGEHFIKDGAFKEVTQPISSGGAINDSNTVDKPIADLLDKVVGTVTPSAIRFEMPPSYNKIVKQGNMVSLNLQLVHVDFPTAGTVVIVGTVPDGFQPKSGNAFYCAAITDDAKPLRAYVGASRNIGIKSAEVLTDVTISLSIVYYID